MKPPEYPRREPNDSRGDPRSGYHPMMPPVVYPVSSPYPGAGTRLGALIIDFLVIGLVTVIFGVALVWNDMSEWLNAVNRWDGTGAAPEPEMASFYLASLISVAIWFLYRVGMETTTSQTLGKMALKIKVVDADGRKLAVGASAIRNIWCLISWAAGLMPYVGWLASTGMYVGIAVTISNHPYRQSFTDKWAKAYVVNAR